MHHSMRLKTLILLFIIFCTVMVWSPNLRADRTAVTVVGSQDYAPFYFLDGEGKPSGLFVDIWTLWSRKTGVGVEFQSMEFADALDDVRHGRADIMAGFFFSETREGDFDFSRPFFEIDTHIFFHEDLYGVKRLQDLAGFRIGVVRGDYAQTYLLQAQVDVVPVVYANFEDLVKAAVQGQVKVFVCDTPVALFLLSKHASDGRFRHTADPLYTSKIYAGTQKGNAGLLVQINQGLDGISPEEMHHIESRWRKDRSGQELRLMMWSGLGLIAVALLLAFFNYQLRRRITHATRDLKVKQRRLESSESALQQVNEELETRVRQRTSQLNNANARLQNQIHIHAETEAKLARQNFHLSALHETMLGLIHRLDLEELLEAIIARTIQTTGAKHGFIYLLNQEEQELELRVGRGIFSQSIGFSLKVGEGLAGKIMDTEDYLLIEDYHHWEGRHPDRFWDHIGSVVGIPLDSGTQTIGVIGVCHVASARQFDVDEIDFLRRFAELASVVLENARLYADLQAELVKRKHNEKLRHQLEGQIQQAQKMEAIGTLAGGIAHDFNNILASILGYTELAMLEIRGNDKVTGYIDNAHTAGMRAKALVQQILEFSRKGEQQEMPVLVTPIIKEVVKLLRASIPTFIDIRQSIDAKDAIISADPVQVHQVIMNLGVNAAFSMEAEGGELYISLENVDLDRAFCSGHPGLEPGRYVRLIVSDTGPGMPPDVLARCFEPYYTTKTMERGTGLGLSVVHGIVQGYGGHIAAESEPGKGACFTIHLPRCDAEVVVPEKPGAPVPGGNERLLLVDDEAELLHIGQEALGRMGYQVSVSKDGLEALNLFRKQPEAFDLVITDITMPHMTGDRLAKELLTINPQLPIIVCSGFSHLINSRKARDIGIRKLIMKPFEIRTLAGAVREALDQAKN